MWKIPDLNEAGIWRLRAGGDVIDAFAVNIDIVEADLTPVTSEEIDRRLGDHVQILETGESLRESVNAARFGRELWRELLVLAGALLLLELWVARSPSSAPAPQAA